MSDQEKPKKWMAAQIGVPAGYTGYNCPKCGRLRLETYTCGRRICEKCRWCVEEQRYIDESEFVVDTSEDWLLEDQIDNTIPIEDGQPHEVAEIMCWRCGWRWIGVYPEKTKLKELVCPRCGNQGFAFKTGQTLQEE